jgi:uncharacterized SAM-binding protein YcdF (DUF218 family)
MTALWWTKLAVKALVLPPIGLLLLALAGLLIARRHPRPGRALALTGVLGLLVLSMPVVGTSLIESLGRTPVLDVAQAGDAQAIVILGGGTRRNAPEYGGPTMNGITLERVRYGARLARMTRLPVLVSGGAFVDTPAEALLMRDALVDEFHVPVRWVEAHSHDTHENAQNSAALLKSSGIARVILVGHSFDFPRSRLEFEAAGIGVIPAPIGVPSREPVTFGDFIPNIGGLQLSYLALYEILANVAFHVTR